MTGGTFEARFEALTGFGPYGWQRRLYAELIAGRRYDALDLPTGLGKTSVMAVWVCARIDGSDDVAAELPRRLIYVVDRRTVVDQATREAEKLARNLEGLIDGPDGARICNRLGLVQRPKSADGAAPTSLPISTLRGQFLDNRRWLDDPGASAIVVGTVDMIGSRLLFSGYGVSRGMRPVHAGLIGVDSLVVIDESHLVPPFEAMLRGVAEIREAWPDRETKAPVALRPLAVMSLSATGRERPGGPVFRLDDEDLADTPVANRLNASKRLTVEAGVPAGKLSERLTELAWAMRFGADGRDGRRVVVFCNSRKTAQEVEAKLAELAWAKNAYGKGARLTELLVGERRYAERTALTGDDRYGGLGSPVFNSFNPSRWREGFDKPQVESGRPAFLVATSAGEVGIDLDADDLVCDLVAWERMVQRFGRVNRRPEPGEARLMIVPTAGEKEAEDEISADRLTLLLGPFQHLAWPAAADGTRQASPAALTALKEAARDVLEAARTPDPLHPPLTRAVVEAWSLTSLERHTGRPNVEPWLRGWVDKDPQTRIVWRRWLPLRKGEEEQVTAALKAYLQEAAPPHLTEVLEAPSWRVAELLRERAKALTRPNKGEAARRVDEMAQDEEDGLVGSALQPFASDGAPADPGPEHAPAAVLLGLDGSVERLYGVHELAQTKADNLTRDLGGATIVLDARIGGLDENGLLDAKADRIPSTADAEGWGLGRESSTGWRVSVGARPGDRKRTQADCWRTGDFRFSFGETEDAPGLWVELWRGAGRNPGDPAIAARAQVLDEHLDQTGRQAERIAGSIGLGAEHRAVLIAAARAHDLGKARDLWQNAMNAPRPPDGRRPYAKTTGGGDGRALDGYRHEFGSLRDVTEAPELFLGQQGVTTPELQDLALHLILAHHGWGRPTVKPYDPDQLPSASAPLAQEAALRFARLQATWGPWGLAWWEALLRAADWAASRALNEEDEAAELAPACAAVGGGHG